jgi:hypothetical protein
MKRRSFLKTVSAASLAVGVTPAWSVPRLADQQAANSSAAHEAPEHASPETILLKDYRPKSLYKIPITQVPKAKYPIIDMHSHAYAKTPEEIAEWVNNMDEVGVEKTILLTETSGQNFTDVQRKFSAYPGRFEIWCGFDYSGYDQPGFGPQAVRALEKCHQAGAGGVGELHEKGKGLVWSSINAFGMHPDDSRMDSLFERCGQLGLPVSIHVADPIWMYEPMDNTNDGLMNAFHWRLDNQPGIVRHSGRLTYWSAPSKSIPTQLLWPATLRIWIMTWRDWGRYLKDILTCMPILPPAMRKQLLFRALPQSFMQSMPIVCSTELTWDSKRRCTKSPSEFSKRRMSTFTNTACSAITGA